MQTKYNQENVNKQACLPYCCYCKSQNRQKHFNKHHIDMFLHVEMIEMLKKCKLLNKVRSTANFNDFFFRYMVYNTYGLFF